MEWLTVILLIVFGIVLIVVELIFVPGTTIVGLLGLGLAVTGVYFSFDYFGNQTGWIVLLSTSVISLSSLVYALRSGAWKKFALKKSIDSRVNEEITDEIQKLQIGDIGETVSALRPIGKVEFGDTLYEARTLGAYVESGNEVKIIRIEDNKIIVEPNE